MNEVAQRMGVCTVDWLPGWLGLLTQNGGAAGARGGNFIVSVQNLWPAIYNVLAVYVLLQFILPRINT